MNKIEIAEEQGYNIEHINFIDIEVVAESQCTECGGECEYVGRQNKSGSYRAFSKCTICNNIEEF